MATLDQLRAAFGGESDADTVVRAAKELGMSPQDIAAEVGVKSGASRGAFRAGLSSGVDQLQSLGYSAVGGVSRAVGLDRAANWANRQADSNMAEAELSGRPDLERVEDQSWGSAGPFAAYQMAKQVPTMAALVGAQFIPGAGQAAGAAGLARAGAMVPRMLGGGGARAGGSYAAQKAALKSGGEFAASAGAGTVLGYGSLYQESREGGDESPYLSALGAPVYGVMEAAVPAAVRAGLRAPGQFSGNLLTRTSKAGAVGAVTEAGTELAQNEMEMAYNGKVSPEEAYSRRLNSAVVGGVVGGPMGSLGGLRGQAPVAPTQTVDDGQFDLTKGFEGIEQRPLRPGIQMPGDPRLGDLTPEWETSQGFEGVTPIPGGADARPGFVGPSQPTTPRAGTQAPVIDTAGLNLAVDDPAISPPGAQITNPAAGLQMPGMDMQGPTVFQDSFGNNTGIPVDEQLMNDPGAAMARERWLAQRAETQQQQQTAAAETQRIKERNERAAQFAIPPKAGQLGVYEQLEGARDEGLVKPEEFPVFAGRIAAGEQNGVRKEIVDRRKQTALAADQTARITQANQQAAALPPAAPAAPVPTVNSTQEAASALLGTPAPADAGATPAGPAPVATPVATGAPATSAPVQAPAAVPVAAPAAVPVKPGRATNGTGDIVSRVKAAGRKATLGQDIDFTALKQILEPLDPRMHHAVRLYLGVDKDGNRLDKPLSMGAAASAAGIGKSHDKVSKVLKELGIDKAVRDRFTVSQAQANERADGDLGEETAALADTAEVAETSTRLLSDESATEDRDEGQAELSAANGFGSITTAAGSQSKIESAKTSSLRSTSWYKRIAAVGGPRTANDRDLITAVIKAAQHELASAQDKQDILALATEIERRARSPEFARALKRAYDQEYDATSKIEDGTESLAEEDGLSGVDEGGDGTDAAARTGGRVQGEADAQAPVAPKAPPTVVRKKSKLQRMEVDDARPAPGGRRGVRMNGDRGYASNDEVIASLRRIAADDDIALEDSSRAGAVMVENVWRIRDTRTGGKGSELLRDITQWADRGGQTLVLQPSGDIAGSREALVKWYERNGFVAQPDGAMVRKPEADGQMQLMAAEPSPEVTELTAKVVALRKRVAVLKKLRACVAKG